MAIPAALVMSDKLGTNGVLFATQRSVRVSSGSGSVSLHPWSALVHWKLVSRVIERRRGSSAAPPQDCVPPRVDPSIECICKKAGSLCFCPLTRSYCSHTKTHPTNFIPQAQAFSATPPVAITQHTHTQSEKEREWEREKEWLPWSLVKGEKSDAGMKETRERKNQRKS